MDGDEHQAARGLGQRAFGFHGAHEPRRGGNDGGGFDVVFRHDLIAAHSEAYLCSGADAYGVLEDAVRAVAAEHNPELDVDDAAKLCWSSMQGLVVLHANMVSMDEGAGRDRASRDELVVRLTRLMIDGFRAR